MTVLAKNKIPLSSSVMQYNSKTGPFAPQILWKSLEGSQLHPVDWWNGLPPAAQQTHKEFIRIAIRVLSTPISRNKLYTDRAEKLVYLKQNIPLVWPNQSNNSSHGQYIASPYDVVNPLR